MSNNDMVSSIGSCWLRKAAKQYNSCRLYIRMAVMSRPCVAERERERDSWSTQILLLSVAPRVFYCYSCTWLVKNPCTLVILSSTTRWPFWTCAFLQLCSTGARAPCLIQITRLSFVGSKQNISSVGHHPRALSSLRHLRADVDLLFHSRSALLYDTANVEPSQQIKEFISTDVPLLYFILCVCVLFVWNHGDKKTKEIWKDHDVITGAKRHSNTLISFTLSLHLRAAVCSSRRHDTTVFSISFVLIRLKIKRKKYMDQNDSHQNKRQLPDLPIHLCLDIIVWFFCTVRPREVDSHVRAQPIFFPFQCISIRLLEKNWIEWETSVSKAVRNT